MAYKDPRKLSKKLIGKYPGYYPQKYLFDYLKQETLDVYDAPSVFLREWAEETGTDLGDVEYSSDLQEPHVSAFQEWLDKNEKGIEYVSKDPYYAPAYLTLKWPKLMPRGRWALHFTKERFESFDQGAIMQNLALSTWTKEKAKAKCPENLSDQLGSFEYVYVFAIDQRKFDMWTVYARKYGHHAMLFQTDAGVEAYHIGDEEDQLMVPACSEYNVIPLRDVLDGIFCRFKDSEDQGLEFASPNHLLRYIEEEEAKGGRPIERLRCVGD